MIPTSGLKSCVHDFLFALFSFQGTLLSHRLHKIFISFCKLSVWVSFYIIPHSVPFVKNFFEIFFIASFKANSASVQLQGFALLYLSDNDIYITTNLHLCQHFYKIFLIFFLCLLNSDFPNTSYPLLMAIWEYPFRHALATFLA